jgi:Carboxypeptidase regulatory-like domain/TonB-dependent Receptor Plug Domain
MKRAMLAVFTTLVCVLLAVSIAAAQTSTTGQIAGTVKDPTGAVVPNAKLTLVSAAGGQQEATADAEGRFRFPLLVPGEYTLTAEAAGFRTATYQAIKVNVTETAQISVPLALQSATETVTISAEPPLVDTDNPTTGRVVAESQVKQLPLPTRNFQQLLTLSPGTVANLSNNTEMGRGDVNIYVNGQRDTSNNVVIDGTMVNSPGTNSTPNISVPSPDAIQEFIVQTSLYDATQGRNSGGNVALVTKSGTSKFHGSAFEFLRNDALNANDYFLNQAGRARPVLKRNQFGGTFGGPIIKDKTYFFISYQGTRERNGASRTNSLMSPNMPSVLTDARATAAGQDAIAQAFLGAATTWANVNPVAQKLLLAKLPNGQWAIPNAAAVGATPATPVTTPISAISRFTEDQFIVNIDQSIGQKNKLSGKFFFSDTPQYQANFTFQGANAFQVPGFGGNIDFHNRVLSLNDTHIFTPNVVNQFHAGYSRINGPSQPEEPFKASDFGITNPLCAGNARFCGMPTVVVAGLFTIGSTSLADQKSTTQTFEFSDTVSWTKGRHFLRFGGEVERYRIDFFFNFYSRGQVNFNTFSDFLKGTSITGLLGAGVRDRGMRVTDLATFIQDDIRVTNNLNLNVGLRVGRNGGISEIRHRLVNFDPAAFAALGRNCTLAAPCAPPNGFFSPDTINPNDWTVAPRFGFSWKPGSNNSGLVVRGGIGVYFNRFSTRFANQQLFNYPYGVVSANIFGTWANPFPAALATTLFPINPAQIPSPVILIPAIPPFLPNPTPLSISGIYADKNMRTPYVYQYNLGIQKEIAKGLLAELGYVGSKGTKLFTVYTYNQGAAGTAPYNLSGFANAKALTAGFQAVETNGVSHYDSLQASLTKRFGNGLQFLAAYTWSKSIDDGSGAATTEHAALPGDQQNLASERAVSDFDRTHRFVLSGVYDLPKFYKGDSAFGKRLINDWEVASIMTFQTGLPFSVVCTSSTTTLNYADVVAGTSPLVSGSVESRLNGYFNSAAFAPTCLNAAPYGTSKRNAYRGPGQKNVDFSLVKFIPIGEKVKAEFRAEFFNAFNMVNFANPISTYTSGSAASYATLGRITQPSTGPRVIQFAVKLSF